MLLTTVGNVEQTKEDRSKSSMMSLAERSSFEAVKVYLNVFRFRTVVGDTDGADEVRAG